MATTELLDLQFLPAKGSKLVTFGASSSSSNAEISVHSGGQTNPYYDLDVDSELLYLGAGYSITDKLYLDLTLPYTIKEHEEIIYSWGSTVQGDKYKRKKNGIGDPIISTKQRIAVNIFSKPFKVDTRISYSPSTGSREYPTTSKKGNFKRGGNAYSVNVEVGSQSSIMAFAFYAKADFFDPAKGKDLFDDSEVTTKAFHAQSLGAKAQIKTSNEKIRLEGELETGIFNSQEITNLENTSSITGKSFNKTAFNFKFLIIPNLLWDNQLAIYFDRYHLSSSSLEMEGERWTTALKTNIIYSF